VTAEKKPSAKRQNSHAPIAARTFKPWPSASVIALGPVKANPFFHVLGFAITGVAVCQNKIAVFDSYRDIPRVKVSTTPRKAKRVADPVGMQVFVFVEKSNV